MENKGIINFMDFFKDNPIKLESDFNKEDFKDFFIQEESSKNEEHLTEELAEEKLQKLDKLMKEVDSLKDEVNVILEEVEEETNNTKTITKRIIKEEVEEIEEEEYEDIQENNDDDFYLLYRDKTELFSCDIMIEGANLSETQARLIVESDEWTLMFEGEITKNGKCNIPINKLSILNEGAEGKIRLEVIADSSVFVPWEDNFKVKLSKKVSIKMNESRTKKKEIKKPGISVNVRR
jgi:hypothetical protein